MAKTINRKVSSKKITKYHYIFFYNRGNYFQISRGLEKRYAKFMQGSGMGVKEFDIHFYCTPLDYKRIVACARRRYGKISHIARYTEKELYEN
jgi:hypothetical protein